MARLLPSFNRLALKPFQSGLDAALRTVVFAPPAGTVFLVDSDGAPLIDADNPNIIEVI